MTIKSRFSASPNRTHSGAFANRTIAYNDLYNRLNTLLIKTNPFQTQNTPKTHCSTNAKTIVRTKKSLSKNLRIVVTNVQRKVSTIKLTRVNWKRISNSFYLTKDTMMMLEFMFGE